MSEVIAWLWRHRAWVLPAILAGLLGVVWLLWRAAARRADKAEAINESVVDVADANAKRDATLVEVAEDATRKLEEHNEAMRDIDAREDDAHARIDAAADDGPDALVAELDRRRGRLADDS